VGNILANLETKQQVQDLYQVLQTVTDPRHQRGKRFEAATVLILMLVAKMAGEHTLLGIADWVRLRIDWLTQVVPVRTGPCANTYQNICTQIDASELSTKVAAFLGVAPSVFAAHETPGAAPPLRHLACDGKVLRGSHRGGAEAQEVLGIFDVTAQCMRAQLPIAGKGYEPAAFTAWLDEQPAHHLDGCLVTADALHTHADVCVAIRRSGGDYLLFVKENQPTLFADIALLFSQAPNRLMPEQNAKSVNGGHGRREVRRLRTSTALNEYRGATWPDLAQVFQIERCITRTRQGVTQTTTETAYCITNLPSTRASPNQLLEYVRAHWQIENRCHWRRDLTLCEDATLLTSKSASMVIAALNNTLLALLDRSGVTNVRRAMRQFAAHPSDALSLLISTK
jgi:predicted transposase YbfD/YdcC